MISRDDLPDTPDWQLVTVIQDEAGRRVYINGELHDPENIIRGTE